jgi:hypothetical protein
MSDSKKPEKRNPFDRLGLDPTLSPAQLTERLQRMAQRLTPEKRDEVRAIWRELTLKDAERVELAFFAHPRGEQTGAEPIDELRRRVPPLSQAAPAPELQARVVDALLEFGNASASTGTQISQALRPDAGFAAIKEEGLSSHQSPNRSPDENP